MLILKIINVNDQFYIHWLIILSYFIIISGTTIGNMNRCRRTKCGQKCCTCCIFYKGFISGLFDSCLRPLDACKKSAKIETLINIHNKNTKLVLSDLSNWMGNLPIHLKTIPFFHLAIPGSHDSITYSITKKSTFAPDAEEWMKNMPIISKQLSAFVSRWSRTQQKNTTAQLKNGIRYLDYRLATKPDTPELFICHALYGCNVCDSFKMVKDFVDKHPGEIVILDIQHFYGFESKDHDYLLQRISEIFGDSLLHYKLKDMHKYTLEYLTCTNKYQVIMIYRARRVNNPYWAYYKFPTPWPDETNNKALFDKLDSGLKKRIMNYGYVSQCIYTPDGQLIVHNWTSNLKHACAKKLLIPLLEWLRKQKPGPVGRLNVTIADFVDLNNWIYPKIVIALNLELDAP